MQQLEEIVGIEEEELIDHTYRPLGLRRPDLVWGLPYLTMAMVVSTFTYLGSAEVAVGHPMFEAAVASAVVVPLLTPVLAAVRDVRRQVFAVLFAAHLLSAGLIAVAGYHAAWLARGTDNFAVFLPLIVMMWLAAVSPAAPVVLAVRALVNRAFSWAKAADAAR